MVCYTFGENPQLVQNILMHIARVREDKRFPVVLCTVDPRAGEFKRHYFVDDKGWDKLLNKWDCTQISVNSHESAINAIKESIREYWHNQCLQLLSDEDAVNVGVFSRLVPYSGKPQTRKRFVQLLADKIAYDSSSEQIVGITSTSTQLSWKRISSHANDIR